MKRFSRQTLRYFKRLNRRELKEERRRAERTPEQEAADRLNAPVIYQHPLVEMGLYDNFELSDYGVSLGP